MIFFEKKILITHNLLNELFQWWRLLKKTSQSDGGWFSCKLFDCLYRKKIAERFTIDMIIDDFYYMKERRAQLK